MHVLPIPCSAGRLVAMRYKVTSGRRGAGRATITMGLVLLFSTSLGWSEDGASSALDKSLKQVQTIQMTRNSDDSAIELIETPLLRFGEPTRGNEKGSVWAWGRVGRPLVISELYHNTGDEESWVQVLTLASTELVTAKTPVGRWAPRTTVLSMKPLAGMPAPADQPMRRLQQMRQIMRSYAAHEFWEPNNSRYELRLLPSPLHRYEDTAAGIIDGAVFAFAHGTNPEIFVFIEAQQQHDATQWHVGFASSGSAEMHVMADGSDIWTLPRATGVTGSPSDPYWLFVTQKGSGAESIK